MQRSKDVLELGRNDLVSNDNAPDENFETMIKLMHDAGQPRTLYKDYLSRRNAVLCNDVFSDDFEDTRAKGTTIATKAKDYYESPFDIPAVK